MTIKETASKVKIHLLPYFDETKTIKQIGQNIRATESDEVIILWNNLENKFIQEYQENRPIADIFDEGDLIPFIKSSLILLNESIKQSIEAALSKLENKNQSNISQSHAGSGKNIIGDKHIHIAGDKTTNHNNNANQSHISQSHSGSGDNVGRDKKVYNIKNIDKSTFN